MERLDVKGYIETVSDCQQRIMRVAKIMRMLNDFSACVRKHGDEAPPYAKRFADRLIDDGVFKTLADVIDTEAREANTIVAVNLDGVWEVQE